MSTTDGLRHDQLADLGVYESDEAAERRLNELKGKTPFVLIRRGNRLYRKLAIFERLDDSSTTGLQTTNEKGGL